MSKLLGKRIRDAARFMGEGFAELLWPTRCAVCDIPGAVLCQQCRLSLPEISLRHACPHCGSPYGWLICTECDPGDSHGGLPFDGVRCAMEYRDGAKRIIQVYKDGGERRLAGVLAQQMSDSLPEEWIGWIDAIVPVPASDKAWRRRGFDHMERVANELSRQLEVPVVLAFNRPRAVDQRGLSRQLRAANVEGVFSVKDEELVRGKNILLIDDVFTTGATLSDASRALFAARAGAVRALTYARVW